VTVRVLVVDDDFRVARLHAQFVQAVPGFAVVAVPPNAAGT
jgi:response regulator of citrate/malate metabolism